MSFSSDCTIFYFINSTCTCTLLWFRLLDYPTTSSINKNPFNWRQKYNSIIINFLCSLTPARTLAFLRLLYLWLLRLWNMDRVSFCFLRRSRRIDSTATNFGLWWIRRRNTAKYRLISCCLENLFSELSWGEHYTKIVARCCGTGALHTFNVQRKSWVIILRCNNARHTL